MNLYNIKHPQEQVNFAQAVRQGLGTNQGLFFPDILPKLDNIDELLDLPLVERSQNSFRINRGRITHRNVKCNGKKCVYVPCTACQSQ